MNRSKKVYLIGKSGRLDCIADAVARSPQAKEIYILSEVRNRGLLEKAEDVELGRTDDVPTVLRYAEKIRPDFAIIGPEEPLAARVVDALEKIGVPCVGPTKKLARVETSKSFTRALLDKYGIVDNPKYRVFHDTRGLRSYLEDEASFVIKPDGLTSGKGVKVFGEHLQSISEALDYCQEIFDNGEGPVIVEEKLDGEEFSFQSFCDGSHVVHTIPVQDHKRAGNDDSGPNTGGMGSYSCADHLLPFLTPEHVEEACRINAEVATALLKETHEKYKGILYGGFMLTKHGLRVIEYNARFGDPEVMNVLPLLDADFIEVCEAIISETLDQIPIRFHRKATVCKYIVPKGYPNTRVTGAKIDISNVPVKNDNMRLFYGAVNGEGDDLCLTASRAIAIVGIGTNLAEAERVAEAAASKITGPVFHRTDIGTSKLVNRRIAHMAKIYETDAAPIKEVKYAV